MKWLIHCLITCCVVGANSKSVSYAKICFIIYSYIYIALYNCLTKQCMEYIYEVRFALIALVCFPKSVSGLADMYAPIACRKYVDMLREGHLRNINQTLRLWNMFAIVRVYLNVKYVQHDSIHENGFLVVTTVVLKHAHTVKF